MHSDTRQCLSRNRESCQGCDRHRRYCREVRTRDQDLRQNEDWSSRCRCSDFHCEIEPVNGVYGLKEMAGRCRSRGYSSLLTSTSGLRTPAARASVPTFGLRCLSLVVVVIIMGLRQLLHHASYLPSSQRHDSTPAPAHKTDSVTTWTEHCICFPDLRPVLFRVATSSHVGLLGYLVKIMV